MSWLKDARVSATIGCLIFSVLVLFFGDWIGLPSLVSRLVVVLITLIVLLGVILFITLRTLGRSAAFERDIKQNADNAVVGVDPTQRAAVAEVRRGLLAAIETLKKSRIGRMSGKAALYELPWYMVIGHPSAGKSSAVLNSGLNFPFADKDKSIIRGLGGTRNCDWFFTTEAVILDTAGRYATEKGDRQEWLEFLRLLKKHRPNAPVNGIIIAVSMVEILNHKGEVSEKYAHQIRERINEIEQVFRMRVPVYLMFTKVDLLGGFSSFFSDFMENERNQVWGATFTHAQSVDFNAVKNIENQFTLLCQGLERIGMERLAHHGDNANRAELFAFPLEFSAMLDKVSEFAAHLFAHDPYHNIPYMRGCYFTSALQSGTADIVAGKYIAEHFALNGPGLSIARQAESRSFFIKNLFREVIFADQHLVWRQTKPVSGRVRWALAATGAAILALFSSVWVYSYQNNKELVADVGSVLHFTYEKDDAETPARILALLEKRQFLKEMHDNGVPFKYRFGLYSGYDLEEKLNALYFSEMKQWLLEPSAEQILATVRELEQKAQSQALQAADAAQLYDALKAYQLLSHAEISEEKFLQNYLKQLKLREQDAEITSKLISAFTQEFSHALSPKLVLDEAIVNHAQSTYVKATAQKSGVERSYQDLIARANVKFEAVSVEGVVGESGQGLISGAYSVPGAFTLDAYQKILMPFVKSAETNSGEGAFDWVLGEAGKAQTAALSEEELARLHDMYLHDFNLSWLKWLASAEIKQSAGFAQSQSILASYASETGSPITKLLKRFNDETIILVGQNSNQLSQELASNASLIEQTRRVLTLSTNQQNAISAGVQAYTKQSDQHKGDEESLLVLTHQVREIITSESLKKYQQSVVAVAEQYESFIQGGKSDEAARKLVSETLSSKASVYRVAMNEAKNVSRELSGGLDSALEGLLTMPLKGSFSALLAPVANEINVAWRKEVISEWKNHSGRFPFAQSENEIPVTELGRILNAENGLIAKFASKNLNDVTSIRNGKVTSLYWEGLGIPLDKTFVNAYSQINDVSNKGLAAGSEALLEVQLAPTKGVKESVLEIDGSLIRYRNGPQYWSAFSWPSEKGNTGFTLSVTTYDGKSLPVLSIPGRMSLVRLLSDPRAKRVDATTVKIELPVAELGGEKISFHVRMVQGINPFVLTELNRVKLPLKVAS